MQKRVFIKSYGCQMNVYDAGRMADALAADNYAETDDMGAADLIILNTCNIREKAADKVYSELGRIRDMKLEMGEAGLNVKVAVAGCVAQAEGSEIMRRSPMVDLVIGPQAYHRLPSLIKTNAKTIDTEFPLEDKFNHLPMANVAKTRTRGASAFLTIQEGCDKFCTFCVVPYTRGAEVSRSVERIVAEAEQLALGGVREITLLGQNVNAWHGLGDDGRTWTLGQLLRRVAKIKGIDRLRYSTSHPTDMDSELIAVHRDLPEVMPSLHLPVQTGSDRILKAMNRKHTSAEYLEHIRQAREARPDIAVTSDFIVGFPGETDQDFEDTMQLVRTVGFASAYSFKYSERPGTPAADLETQVPEEIKSTRLAVLQALIQEQQTAFNRACIGRVVDVLFEKPGRNEGQIMGKSPYLQAVNIQGPLSWIGQIKAIKITGIASNSLAGEAIAPHFQKGDSAFKTEAL